MALFDIIIPQLVNCGQNCEQAYSEMMGQDWNHWKYQVCYSLYLSDDDANCAFITL